MEESQEFREKKEIMKIQAELDLNKHNFKMQELEFERASAKLNHEMILERGRIQRAEQRKMFSDTRERRY